MKHVEVIGARSRSWPIRDAKDQLRLISSATSGEPVGTVTPPNGAANTREQKLQKEERDPTASPSKKHIKDPYAAESLFDLLSPSQDRTRPAVAPRAPAAAKPPPRDYGELFVGEDDTAPAQSSPSRPIAPKVGAGKNFKRSPLFVEEDESGALEGQQPDKPIAPKAGAGKNFRASRLFVDEEAELEEDKEVRYKTHPQKFSHFQLGDNGEQEVKPVPGRPKSQHTSQWNFEDFVTPEKPKPKVRPNDTRHFAWSDDEVDQETPPARPHVAQPRRDAETHFKLQDDDDIPEGEIIRPRRTIGAAHNKGLGLYENNLYDEHGNPTPHQPESKAPLAIIPNGTHRKKDFDSHWSITDADPPEDEKVSHENKKPIGHDKLKHIKQMDASWAAYDESPEQQKVAQLPKRLSRHVPQPSWTLGDEDNGF